MVKVLQLCFSPEVALWIVAVAVGVGVTMALAPTHRNVRLAHPFFLIAAVWALGCTFEWLVRAGEINMRYGLAFVIGGAIFTLAVAGFRWVEANHAEQLAATQSSTTAVTAQPNAGDNKRDESEHKDMPQKPVTLHGEANPIPSVTQGAGSAFSLNQQGGITAGTINVGPPPLLISTEQRAHLTASVQPFVPQFVDKKINISLHNATTETAEFGAGLDAAFRAAGFQTNTGPVSFIGAAPSRGVTIRFGTNRAKLAEAVRDSLLRDKVVDKVYAAPGIDADDFLIIVAP